MMGPEQLGRLLDEHAAALVLYARQWCCAPDDVVQEAFIKLATQDPREPVPWLYKVVRNAAHCAARSERRRLRREQEAAAQAPVWFLPAEGKRLDEESATAALQSLPEEEREIIIAHLWGGLTFEQVGAVVGTSSSSAHRRYLAGLSELRERLGVPCPKTTATPKCRPWKPL
jgi:RNA polymerase sigma-70 factor (ECF subfamily)